MIFVLSGILGFATSYYHSHQSSQQYVMPHEIETFHYPATFVNQLIDDPQAGKKIFKEFCSSCHGAPPLIDVHAPLIQDKKAWDINQKLGMKTLLNITIHGSGAMPARGGCFECSDGQLRQAIQYILDSSNAN